MATDESEETVSEEVLNSLMGHTIKNWYVDDGLYFILDDGRKIFLVALAVIGSDKSPCLH